MVDHAEGFEPADLDRWTAERDVPDADEAPPPPVDADRAGAGLQGSHGPGGPVDRAGQERP